MSCVAKMSCYNGMPYTIAQGSLKECRDAVKRYLARREKRGGHGPVIRLNPLTWECCDNDCMIGDFDGIVSIRKEE
jgi:hypothetical protein